jgi:hypothetical protein
MDFGKGNTPANTGGNAPRTRSRTRRRSTSSASSTVGQSRHVGGSRATAADTSGGGGFTSRGMVSPLYDAQTNAIGNLCLSALFSGVITPDQIHGLVDQAATAWKKAVR